MNSAQQHRWPVNHKFSIFDTYLKLRRCRWLSMGVLFLTIFFGALMWTQGHSRVRDSAERLLF